jgi:hypothetical protein
MDIKMKVTLAVSSCGGVERPEYKASNGYVSRFNRFSSKFPSSLNIPERLVADNEVQNLKPLILSITLL